MEKIKAFWSKLKYWQKGSLIGLLVGIIFNFYIYKVKTGQYLMDGVASWQAIPNILPLILHSFIFSSAINESATLSTYIFILIWYTILGTLIGLIYKFIKQKYPKHLTLLFTIILIIFIVFILLVNFLILMGLLSIYA